MSPSEKFVREVIGGRYEQEQCQPKKYPTETGVSTLQCNPNI